MWTVVLLGALVLGVCGQHDTVVDHGDFSCPWQEEILACKQVCVSLATDCPVELSCPVGQQICDDGGCYDNATDCPEDLEAACDCGVPCAMNSINGTPTECYDAFSEWYDGNFSAGDCTEPFISYASPGLMFCWIFVPALCFVSVFWCCCNQRVIPRGKPMLVDDHRAFSEDTGHGGGGKPHGNEIEMDKLGSEQRLQRAMTIPTNMVKVRQLGYKGNLIGEFLLLLHIGTILGFQIALLLLTISYYYINGEPMKGPGLPQIKNSDQALYLFEVAWMCGLAYMLLVASPPAFRVHFKRRCPLAEAQYVEVWSPSQSKVLSTKGAVDKMMRYTEKFTETYRRIFNSLYSDVERPSSPGTAELAKVTTDPVTGSRYLVHHLRQFVYDDEQGMFVPCAVPMPETLRSLVAAGGGLSTKEALTRVSRVGPNKIALPKPNLIWEIALEFSKPFYIYQNFMYWSWVNFDYWHMGILGTIVYVMGGLSVAFVTWNNKAALHALVTAGEGTQVQVLRDGAWVTVPTDELAPGDIIKLAPGIVSCDMVLLQGKISVDESSLTGESMPVQKEAINPDSPEERFSTKKHKKHAIFAGTTVLPMADELTPIALVRKTGVDSDKGEQVCRILYQPPPQFKFDIQVKIVVAILALYAIGTFILVLELLGDTSYIYGWFYAIYVVNSALPPLLPTVFVVAVGWSASRLQTKKVLCSEPSRLLMAGKVRVFCFDKTGTLTEQGMQFHSTRPVEPNKRPQNDGSWSPDWGDAPPASGLASFAPQSPDVPGNPLNVPLTYEAGMACCQAVGKQPSGELIGPQVDIHMLKASTWELEVGKGGAHKDIVRRKDGEQREIVHRYDFSHVSHTMAVLVRNPATRKHMIFVKGSAEAVVRRCLAETVPHNYRSMSDEYAAEGCYTMALACRECTAEEEANLNLGEPIERDAVERSLVLLGLLMFKNNLKPDSAANLALLREGSVRTLMITGDHPLTGIHIAGNAGLFQPGRKILFGFVSDPHEEHKAEDGNIQWVWVDGTHRSPAFLPSDLTNLELVLTGDAYRAMTTAEQQRVFPHVRVFARVSPADKVAVVKEYQNMGFIVGMCGDGGNDCGALREAHVGVALSDAEASVVSPFTGTTLSVRSVVDVLLEGRCSLASAFACYKYMLMYGQIETIVQVVNAYFAINLGQWCWVFMDGFWMVFLSFALSLARPAELLSKFRPPSSLLGAYTMFSMCGAILIDFLFMVFAFIALNDQDWYQCRKWDPDSATIGNLESIVDNYEASTIFLVMGYQYVSAAMIFNFGHYHRKMWVFNWLLMFLLAAFTAIHFSVVLTASHLSCFFRVNCDFENAVPNALALSQPDPEPEPIGNLWGTTWMPPQFRRTLLAIIIVNTIVLFFWEYCVVLGPVGRFIRRYFPNTTKLDL